MKGYTLIELLITVAIVGIIAAVILPVVFSSLGVCPDFMVCEKPH